MFSEYPKWIRHPGQPDVLVENEAAELAQRGLWDAVESPQLAAPKRANALLAHLHHDGDREPGGSKKPDGDVAVLRARYKEKFGKRPFPGWGPDDLKAKLGE